MFETINESVDVIASFTMGTHGRSTVLPQVMRWRGKRYRMETFGLYHPARRGDKQIHVFQFSSGSSAFRLELDPETLSWTLMEIYHDSGA